MSDFSFSTVENFDSHIDKSIRGYSSLIDDVCDISRFFIEDHSKVIDIGCSTGKMLHRLKDSNSKTNVSYVGIEIEENFTKDLHNSLNVDFYKGDACAYDDWSHASFISSIFTLQFMNTIDRINLVRKIYDGLNPGGVFVFSEKVFIDDARTQSIISSIHYDFKRKSFSDSDILDKEYSLREIMRPNILDDLVGENGYIRQCGFSKCFQFWQNHNFCGWMAIK